MSPPAPEGTLDRTPDPNRATNLVDASGEVCPDVIAYMDGWGRPYSPSEARYVQRIYDNAMSARIDREDFADVLTRILGRSGSRPVDRLGDRAAAHLTA